MKVSVSILKEYDNLINSVKRVNESSADFLHVDVMDGKFVDNTKFTVDLVKKIKSISKKKLDVHLMVEDEDLIKKYADLLPEFLTFHVEIIKNKNLINYVKEKNIKVGLAINPQTSIKKLLPYINYVDLILFMSVNPGKPAQKFEKNVAAKIKEFKKISPSNLIISIDGGVNDETIKFCKNAKCDMVVSGSYVTDSNDYDEKISKLR